MEDKKKNSKQQLQGTENEETRKYSKKQSKGIRCYGQTGFFAPEKQPDGTIIQKFYYGREGD